jgi:hypothetical protein
MIVNQMKNYHEEVDECAALRKCDHGIVRALDTHLMNVPQNTEITIEFCVVLGFQL